jgi:hypothetical protein
VAKVRPGHVLDFLLFPNPVSHPPRSCRLVSVSRLLRSKRLHLERKRRLLLKVRSANTSSRFWTELTPAVESEAEPEARSVRENRNTYPARRKDAGPGGDGLVKPGGPETKAQVQARAAEKKAEKAAVQSARAHEHAKDAAKVKLAERKLAAIEDRRQQDDDAEDELMRDPVSGFEEAGAASLSEGRQEQRISTDDDQDDLETADTTPNAIAEGKSTKSSVDVDGDEFDGTMMHEASVEKHAASSSLAEFPFLLYSFLLFSVLPFPPPIPKHPARLRRKILSKMKR